MPNYLYLFRGGADRNRSPQELQENMGRWGAWIGELSKQGKFKAGEPLASEGKVVAGKKKSVTDGPFGETKDVVGGYLIVTAADINGAVEMSRGCPIFDDSGSVEVRELREMPM